MTQISAREFNQDVSAAKRAAEQEPVVITDRGRPSHVLLSIAEYDRLRGTRDQRTLAERLRMPVDIDDDLDRELELARATSGLRVPDL